MVSSTVIIESKFFIKRSASALVPPRLSNSQYERLKLNKLSSETIKLKERCKVVPLKGRTKIKADTIFTGTVIKFYNQPNRWIKKMDLSISRKGKKKFDYSNLLSIFFSDIRLSIT